MARRKAQAKKTATVADGSDDPADVPKRPRKTPAWHRQYLRRLAIHGDRERAARESNISIRQVDRIRRAYPRFDKGVRIALRMALEAHTQRMQSRMIDLAENGYDCPVVSGGKHLFNTTKYIPSLMKLVAEITVPMFRDAKERDQKNNGRFHGLSSVSNITNNVNLSLAHASVDDPETLALMLALSDRLTRARSDQQAIDVSPPDDKDS